MAKSAPPTRIGATAPRQFRDCGTSLPPSQIGLDREPTGQQESDDIGHEDGPLSRQGRALSGHKTKQSYAGYAKQTLERALPATRKRYAHRLANVEGTKFQNIAQNSFQNDPEGNNSGTA